MKPMTDADWKKLREEIYARNEASRRRRENSVANRLHRKLIECGFQVHKPERLRPGHWQRSSGAWAWQAKWNSELAHRNGWIGFQDTMANCAKMTNEILKDEILSYSK